MEDNHRAEREEKKRQRSLRGEELSLTGKNENLFMVRSIHDTEVRLGMCVSAVCFSFVK